MKTDIPSHLSDDDLVARVKALARCEREATACLLAHLAELDARRLYLGAGFPSLFTYCCEVLHLSEPAAYNRIEAARAARRFPVIFRMLGEGSLNVTTARLLARHLIDDDHKELLAAASGKTKREVEELLVRYFPQPAVPSSVRRLPAVKPLPAPTTALASAPAAIPALAMAPARPPVVKPLAPDRYEIRFTATAATREKLRRAQDLLRHAVPTGDLAEVIDRALSALLEDLARKRFAETERPRATRGTAPGSRDISAKVRRTVWHRDRGVCAFVSKSGRRCKERAFIQFHHVDPHSVGGEAMVGNIQLRCGAHNRYESELFYGHGRPTHTPERRTRPGKSSALPP